MNKEYLKKIKKEQDIFLENVFIPPNFIPLILISIKDEANDVLNVITYKRYVKDSVILIDILESLLRSIKTKDLAQKIQP